MKFIDFLKIGIKVLFHLDFWQVLNYFLYQAGIHCNYFFLLSKYQRDFLKKSADSSTPNWFLTLPDKGKYQQFLSDKNVQLKTKADEIATGKMLFYGKILAKINLKPAHVQIHWSKIKTRSGLLDRKDIKDIWEPARFGWAFSLARAYHLTGEDRYAQYFWKSFDIFSKNNPPDYGPNWISAQEAALRIIACTFTAHIIRDAPSTNIKTIRKLSTFIAQHAMRIPATVCYAKAQNNNHWISEAVGLYTAGVFLKNNPKAKRWKKLGWKWFNQAIHNQINEQGAYIQNSANYHRMMLDLCLWMWLVASSEQEELLQKTRKRIMDSISWIASLIDFESGSVPNLGHNDGSLIMPLSECEYGDYRPTIQAASRAFLGKRIFPQGEWDEYSLWLNLINKISKKDYPGTEMNPSIHRVGNSLSWARMQAAEYHHRPAHADQLHVDIWFQGCAVTLDPGTYRYNAEPPWNNSLTTTSVHNTIAIDDLDQMTHAGRFLWLDWAQAKIISKNEKQIIAEHKGYHAFGLTHRRRLTKIGYSNWEIQDHFPLSQKTETPHRYSSQWLFPDWEWKLNDKKMVLTAPFGNVFITILNPSVESSISICRAGKVLFGKLDDPIIYGWYSPSYSVKIPAISLIFSCVQKTPTQITTNINIEKHR